MSKIDTDSNLSILFSHACSWNAVRLTYAEEAIDSSDDEDTSGGKKAAAAANSGELQHIQMMTALVLQMIHAIAHLPLPDLSDEEMSKQEKNMQHQVKSFVWFITTYS